ncbi:DUF2478 domain-containing protein [Bosea thiooxidans]
MAPNSSTTAVSVISRTVSPGGPRRGRRFPISQDLGAGAAGCHLDAAGLAAASAAFAGALAERADSSSSSASRKPWARGCARRSPRR